MSDVRCNQLAKKLVNFSANVQKGDKVLVEITGEEHDLGKEIIREIYAAGGKPFFYLWNDELQKEWLMGLDEETVALQAQWDAERMSKMDAYIAVRLNDNLYDLATVPKESMELYARYITQKVHFGIRISKKWVVVRYPNASMAQLATMPTDEFRNFYFSACNFDYEKLDKYMTPLFSRVNQADIVEIKGVGVDLKFSIKGMNSLKCCGKNNLPDGELLSAPVRESVEGYITYNTPSPYLGDVFDRVRLEFKRGQIVRVSHDGVENQRLNAIFDSDEGARYIGEFSFGLNPFISKPMKDILFDEKISGSFHFTPGNACFDINNGNKSSIHWDLVYITRKDYGGAEIYFDGILIQKDGLFVPADLQPLNPENLRQLLTN